MTFLNLSLLAGTALVALPIVLHLIMRQKPRQLEFPALRFIQKRHDANRRRLRLRHLILLLLRAAAIALLACALARPSVKLSGNWGSQEAPVAAAMVFDTAPRMEYRHQNQTRIEAAAELGQWLLAQLPADSEIAVLDTRGGPGAFQVDRGAARQRIERLEPVPNSRPLTEVVEEAARLVGTSELARREIYVFSDLARTAWPTETATTLQNRLAETPDVGLYVIDVGVADPQNFALGELYLSGDVLSRRSALVIRSELARMGPEGSRNVQLYLDDAVGNPVMRSEQDVAVADGEAQAVEFRLGALDLGTHQGNVRIVGADGLDADNSRYFTVEVLRPWRVLIAAPKPAARHALYVSEALAPAVFRKQGQARFECQVVELDELAKQPLGDYAAVLLLDPSPLKPAEWQRLGDYVAEGHGLGIFLGRRATPVDSFNTKLAQQLLPGKLVRQARSPEGDNYLSPQNYQNPMLNAFRAMETGVPWDQFPVFRYWQLEDPKATVVNFADGRPALLERSLGRGRVVTMTTPLSDDPNQTPWNLLPVGDAWPFLVLINQVAGYLVGSIDQQLNYVAGQPAVLQLEDQSQRRSYLLTSPDGLKFPATPDMKRGVLVVTSTDQVGNYRVQSGGRDSGVDRGFSVNLAPGQTDLRRIAPEALAEVFGPHGYRVARTPQQLEVEQQKDRVGRELFPLLILLVAAALAIEHVVANKFYRE